MVQGCRTVWDAADCVRAGWCCGAVSLSVPRACVCVCNPSPSLVGQGTSAEQNRLSTYPAAPARWGERVSVAWDNAYFWSAVPPFRANFTYHWPLTDPCVGCAGPLQFQSRRVWMNDLVRWICVTIGEGQTVSSDYVSFSFRCFIDTDAWHLRWDGGDVTVVVAVCWLQGTNFSQCVSVVASISPTFI